MENLMKKKSPESSSSGPRKNNFTFLVRFVRKIPALPVWPVPFPNSGPDFSHQPTFFQNLTATK